MQRSVVKFVILAHVILNFSTKTHCLPYKFPVLRMTYLSYPTVSSTPHFEVQKCASCFRNNLYFCHSSIDSSSPVPVILLTAQTPCGGAARRYTLSFDPQATDPSYLQ
jgi:hypothetical protein